MQFRLPEQLQNELLPYDPSLKALARQQRTTSTYKKPKFPLGQPSTLIPSDIVKQSDIDDAIEGINASLAPERYHVFTKIKNVATPEATTATHAIIYHFEKVWYAAWLPPENKKDEYIYGFSIAYKDTESVRKSLPYCIRSDYEERMQEVQFGRSTFKFYQVYVTKKAIIDGFDDHGWNLAGVPNYYQKSGEIKRAAINGFEEQLKNSIPRWEDSKGIFDRLRSNDLVSILFDGPCDLDAEIKKQLIDKGDWQPSYLALQKLILDHAHTSGYSGETFKELNKIIHILDTPFFRKWIQERCDECVAKINDPDNTTLQAIRRPWKVTIELLASIYRVNVIWPECPIDYYQTHINVLIGTRWNKGRDNAVAWLNKNMPVASFFGALTKFYDTQQEEQDKRGSCSYYYSTALARTQYSFHDWNDTCSMISTLLDHDKEVPIPKRWRIEEFHNTVQAEAWKIRNPNESLPQDLFPSPIKVQHQGQTWTFFQPSDTHQLAMWGQAVRNCIGSASGYAEGVRKKKHFLVLCMVDNCPRFTVQLDVDMGMMRVKQIVGLSNARLSPEDQDTYTKVFASALQAQEDRLKSGQMPESGD